MVVVLLVKCTASKDNPRNGKSSSTARYCASVATTQSAIVASGGATDIRDGEPVLCSTVEVYSSETSQWHTADPAYLYLVGP